MVTTYIAIMVTVAFAVVAIALMMRKERREKEEYKQFEAMREAPLSPPMTQPAPDPSLGLKEVQKGTALMRGAVVVGGDVIVFQIEFAVQDERWMDNGIPTMKGPRIFLQPLTHRLGDSIATKLAECAKRPDRPVPKAIAQSALAGSLATTLRVQGLPEECITAKLKFVGRIHGDDLLSGDDEVPLLDVPVAVEQGALLRAYEHAGARPTDLAQILDGEGEGPPTDKQPTIPAGATRATAVVPPPGKEKK